MKIMKKKSKDKKLKQEKISKNMSFEELINDNPEARELLLSKGMHCIGCPMASFETIEQGAIAHGIDPDEIIEDINKNKKK
jgi:hybrid cluster-associated redox disulfide protein